jgi:hypothetical protein
MPEKHLPFYRLQLQGKEKQPKSQSKYSSTPNFIFQEEYLPYNAVYMFVAASFLRKLSYAIVIVFGLMLLLNNFFNLKLESQRIVNGAIADRLQRFTPIERTAREVDRKTKFYEQTLSERSLLGEKTRVIFSKLNPQIKLESANVNLTDFELQIIVFSPLDFARLTNEYLQEKQIASIILQRADYRAGDRSYSILLKGSYK